MTDTTPSPGAHDPFAGLELDTPQLAAHERMRAAGTRLTAAATCSAIPSVVRELVGPIGLGLVIAADHHQKTPCDEGDICPPLVLADILLGNRAG